MTTTEERLAAYLEGVLDRTGFSPADIWGVLGGLDDHLEFSRQLRDDPVEVLKHRIHDAVVTLRFRRDRDEIQAARERTAAQHNGVVCERCGGEGGHRSWPGFVCYDCGGRGYTPRPT